MRHLQLKSYVIQVKVGKKYVPVSVKATSRLAAEQEAYEKVKRAGQGISEDSKEYL